MLLAFVFWLASVVGGAVIAVKYQDRPRLPMQWSLTGTVNWSAPTLVAAFTIPVLIAVTSGFVWSQLASDQHSKLAVLTGSGLAVQLLYFFMLTRS